MRTLKSLIVGGIAALTVGATAAVAADSTSNLHTMTVALPDGGSAVIRYAGDVKPNVRIAQSPFAADPFAAAFLAPSPVFFAPDSNLLRVEARMDQMQMQMAREMDRMIADTQSLAALPLADANAPIPAALANLPAGTESYSFVSTTNGGKTCAKLTTITATGHGKPNVTTKTSGDCGPANAPAAKASGAI